MPGQNQTGTSVALLVCDVQERFRPLIAEYPTVISTTARMVRAAAVLDIPVLVTEQNPRRLGDTVPEVKGVLPPGTPVFPKTKFSMATPEALDFLRSHCITDVAIVGIEAPICVYQTVSDLLALGFKAHVLVDGVSAQRPTDRDVALLTMQQAGARLCTSDMLLFQLANDSSHPRFRDLSKLIKEPRVDRLPLFLSKL